MTSVSRNVPFQKSTQLEYVRISGPYYRDVTAYLPFPFTYNNGELDIALIDGFPQFLYGTPPITAPLSSVDGNFVNNNCLFKLMGTNGIVTSLGPTFLKYIRAWRNLSTHDSISIHIHPVVTKTHFSSKSVLNTGSAFKISQQPPSGDGYVIGEEENDFRTIWVFKTPMTLLIKIRGGPSEYITLNTTLY